MLASSFTLSPSTTPILDATASSTAESTSTPVTAPQTVKEQVNEYFKDNPIMVKIAWCESRFRQYDKAGNLFRGLVNDRDIGVMQVNTDYHAKEAAKLGLDLTTIEGNMAFAKQLFDREGTAPWISSSACWKTSKADVALLTK